MQVKSILQYFRPALSYHMALRLLFCIFLSCRLRKVSLYIRYVILETYSSCHCLSTRPRSKRSKILVVCLLLLYNCVCSSSVQYHLSHFMKNHFMSYPTFNIAAQSVHPCSFGLNVFISNQFIQYNTIFNHTNIRIRTEARAYQVLLLYNILTKCRWQ